ncbi:TonB-linked SusC/RagA family outer membrane protein [Anseongella ginsenosidimutans]|uniref:TonB-linked SusC/RagA family outer membrane protein n=2 Tax=Anseongella ginsenosidimutans TaxID=496056 RepID=A0A4R3KNL2_9SPHI|nr:TonB-linked SusC/RagA family outer membrane protein [Anseongella ginsenosidimutans]
MCKILLAMKLHAVLLLAGALQVSAGSFSQSISFQGENVTLEKVFTAINQQTDYSVFYNYSVLKDARPVTLNLRNTSVQNLLDASLKGQGLTYSIEEKLILIKRTERSGPLLRPPSAIDTIRGSVTDADGFPLPGVSVQVKGTLKGTLTNEQGKYELPDADQGELLVFSFLGFKTVETLINGQAEISITLHQDIAALDEIVVIGYGEQERRDITSAISSVKGDDVENNPIASVDNLLQGRAAGVQVLQTSGEPGTAVSVRVRGYTSIGGGNEPLYIVDGVPIKSGSYTSLGQGSAGFNALADINPNDIASIEILKDASATSIYGARASNGVVLITTKRGRAGKPTLSLNFYSGVSSLANKLPVLNGKEHRAYFTEAWLNRGRGLRNEITDSLNWTFSGDTDWQDEIFRSASANNADFSLRGGSDQFKYAVSGGYFKQEGILLNSVYERLSGRVNTEYQATKSLTIGSNLSYSISSRNTVRQGSGNNFPIWMALRTFSFLRSTDTLGRLWKGTNPIRQLEDIKNEENSDRIIANLYGELEIIENLKLRSNIAVDLLSLKEDRFTPASLLTTPLRQANSNYYRDRGWVNENTLTYQTNFNSDHHVSALAGFSQQANNIQVLSAFGSGAASDKIPTINASASIDGASSNETSWGIFSLFGRVNYSFKDRYLLNATIRRDGSSRFGRENRFGTFPSFSAGWRIAEESFMQNSSLVQELKLRVSYGVTGNQSIGNFISQGLFNAGENYMGQGGIGPASNGIPNPDLSWESTNQFDIGLDLSVFDNRIYLIADYYHKRTHGLLFNVDLPGTSGYNSLTTNLGEIENKGYELTLHTKNLTGDFQWSTEANFSYNQNKVISLPNGEDQFAGLGIVREGEPLGSFYGWVFDGVYARDEDVPEGLTTGGGIGFEGGDAIFRDLNGDNRIDENDLTIIGNAQPDFVGGLSNSFSYKGFDLSILFTYSGGNEIFNAVEQMRGGNGFSQNPRPYIWKNAWREQGDITDVPVNWMVKPVENDRNSSRWVEDGSYLRLKNISLSYNLNAEFLNRYFISGMRIYVTGQNVWTGTSYLGYDPEVVTTSSDNSRQFGIDNGRMPIPRTFMMGINVTF